MPEVAAFSSRGPSITTSGDILKPDIAAPGVDVLAAVSPVGATHYGRNYDLISGTSMASPHIAGLGALLYQKHTDWTPMMIKSALMTTAPTTHPPDASDGGVFAQGAGFVQPNPAADPGIVFDSGLIDWLGYLETYVGDLDAAFGAVIPTVDGSQLNQASIALGSLTGVETVTRTLTNVSGQSETYTPSVDLPGIEVDLRSGHGHRAGGCVARMSRSPSPGTTRRPTSTPRAASPGPATTATWPGCRSRCVRSTSRLRPR